MGGGTAGSVLAARLAEDQKLNILVVEAGHDPTDNSLIDVPLMADSARNSKFASKYYTAPQKTACKGHTNKVSLNFSYWIFLFKAYKK